MDFNLKLSVLLAAILGTGLQGSAVADEAMNAEFRTMASCLAGIKKSSGQTLKIITDTPAEVSGLLANGKGFACERKASGTKGVFFHGWFMVE